MFDVIFFLFFFKQKTAYELRISDWSSDVCSSDLAAGNSHTLRYFDASLSEQTVALTAGSGAICAFVNDRLDRNILAALHGQGTRLVALRCAGFNHVNLEAAEALGIVVARGPAYSPEAIADRKSVV